jgi:nitrogen fixation NifU-like protein
MSQSSTFSAAKQNLYQDLILDHQKNPRRFFKNDQAPLIHEGHNPVCGDHYHLYVTLNEDNKEIIKELSFFGEGCAISKASGSLLCSILAGKSVQEARDLFEEFHRLLTRKLDPEKDVHHLGKLEVFSHIWKYPSRVKCAGLIWHTLMSALAGDRQVTVTE